MGGPSGSGGIGLGKRSLQMGKRELYGSAFFEAKWRWGVFTAWKLVRMRYGPLSFFFLSCVIRGIVTLLTNLGRPT